MAGRRAARATIRAVAKQAGEVGRSGAVIGDGCVARGDGPAASHHSVPPSRASLHHSWGPPTALPREHAHLARLVKRAAAASVAPTRLHARLAERRWGHAARQASSSDAHRATSLRPVSNAYAGVAVRLRVVFQPVSSDDDRQSVEADGASSDEEAHGAALLDGKESAPEGTFRPEDNFDTLMEVFRFIVGCNNDAGLSNESTVWLLNLLRDERLELERIRHWRTLYAVIRFGMNLLMSRRNYETTTFTIPGWDDTFQVVRTSGTEVSKGLAAKDPTGVDHFFVPLLFSYVADYPETCKVSCTQQLASAMPCSICYVGRGQLRDMERDPADHRTVQQQEQLVGDPTEAKEYSTIPIPTMYPDTRLAGLCPPGSGSYWASGANFTASEHASAMMVHYALAPFALEGEGEIVNRLALVTVLGWHESGVRAPSHSDVSLGDFEQATKRMIQTVESVFPREGDGWNLIKVHLLTHVPESVRRAGLPSQYSAAVYENAHIRTCKLPYRTSNRRQPLQAIAAHNMRAAALAQLTTALPARRRNQTALTRAIVSGSPQLTATRKSLTARPDHDLDAGSVFEEINKAVGGLLMDYDTKMHHAGLRPFPAWAHTAVALPALPTDHGHIKPHYARAAASLHGRTAFSCVEYDSARGQTQYGRLLMLLDAERPLDDSNHEPAEVAVLQRLTPQGLDQCTGCQMLGPPVYYRGLAVVPISQLCRAVHCVPSFNEPDLWYLNKWAYLINEERD
ncbi:unnamed protein product [Closterium sp. Naga37s-1]|nr:unnamed protein product [Closterium sp. Naga37s-1]